MLPYIKFCGYFLLLQVCYFFNSTNDVCLEGHEYTSHDIFFFFYLSTFFPSFLPSFVRSFLSIFLDFFAFRSLRRSRPDSERRKEQTGRRKAKRRKEGRERGKLWREREERKREKWAYEGSSVEGNRILHQGFFGDEAPSFVPAIGVDTSSPVLLLSLIPSFPLYPLPSF